MALFVANEIDVNKKSEIIAIPSFLKKEDYAVFVIRVSLGGIEWTLERRYKEFLQFDRGRFKKLSKESMLPPKKAIGNMDEEFLEKRRKELETYLRTVFELEIWLQRRKHMNALPRDLALFLHFDKYEIHGLLESLAHYLSDHEESILNSNDFFTFSPLQLRAISERLRLPEPSFPGADRKSDFSHVIDFAHRLKHLRILGNNKPVGTSNIHLNSLPFDLMAFKSLETLWLSNCNSSMLSGLSIARKTVTCLVVTATATCFKAVLPAGEDESLAVKESLRWPSCKMADFSSNVISSIDESVLLLCHVTRLNLSDNQLTDLANLQHLPSLAELNLSKNRLEKLDKWNLKLGNLKKLILSDNRIKSLRGLRKLYSIEYLDVQRNGLVLPRDVSWIGGLPCLGDLLLNGNPVESTVEYRTRILEAFGERAAEVRLDGKKPSEREQDTIGVRLAIRKAREDRDRILRKANEEISRTLEQTLTIPSTAADEDSNDAMRMHHVEQQSRDYYPKSTTGSSNSDSSGGSEKYYDAEEINQEDEEEEDDTISNSTPADSSDNSPPPGDDVTGGVRTVKEVRVSAGIGSPGSHDDDDDVSHPSEKSILPNIHNDAHRDFPPGTPAGYQSFPCIPPGDQMQSSNDYPPGRLQLSGSTASDSSNSVS